MQQTPPGGPLQSILGIREASWRRSEREAASLCYLGWPGLAREGMGAWTAGAPASLLPMLVPGTSPLEGPLALPSVTLSLLPELHGTLTPLVYLFPPGILGTEPSVVAVWLLIIKDTVLRLGS